MQSRSLIAVVSSRGRFARLRMALAGALVAACALAAVPAPAGALISDAPVSALYATGPVYALARAPDNSIYVGGDFTAICTSTTVCAVRPRIAHISAAGALLPALGGAAESDTNGAVRALAVAPDGNVYAGGDFGLIGGTGIGNAIARWDGARWNALRSGLEGPVYAIAILGASVFVGGDFAGAAGTSYPNVVRWDGATWQPAGLGASGPVLTLVSAGSSVWAGGSFDRMFGASDDTARIARWDGSTWQPLGKGITGSYDEVRAIAVNGADVYAGGAFTVFGPDGAPTKNVARFDGAGAWHPLGAGSDGPINALAYAGAELYAGGDFGSLGPLLSQRLAAWNGTAWSKVGTGADAAVRALAFTPDGQRLFAGGIFARIGGAGHPNLAIFAPPAAADRVAPKLTGTILAQKLGVVLSKGLKVQVTCDEALKVAVRASVRGRRVGEVTRTLKAKKATTITIRLTASSIRRLRRARSTPFSISASAVDRSGNHGTGTATRLLKR